MRRKLNLKALIGLVAVVAIVVGVLVWPPPKAALAMDQFVSFSVDWQGDAVEYDIAAVAQFLNSGGGVVAEIALDDLVVPWTYWSGTYFNVHSSVVSVRIVFDDQQFNWDIGSPNGPILISWSNPQPINRNDACWE